MQEQIMRMFMAHSPAPETMRERCEIFFTDQLSICTLIKKPENIMPAFCHVHDEYEFIVPHTPIPFLLNDDAVYFGEVGYVLPVQSGRSHGMKYNLSDVSHSDIVVRKEYFEKLMQQKGVSGIQFNYEFPMGEELKFYLDTFKNEFRRGGQADRYKLRLLGDLICLELIVAGTDPSYDTRKKKQSYQKGIQSASEYIIDNYRQEITVEELAEICGFSKNYFIKMFKMSLGESPHSYMTKLRISRAKLFLETSSDSIQQIAEQCGFKKANSFSSQFKASTGMTPKEYRESRR